MELLYLFITLPHPPSLFTSTIDTDALKTLAQGCISTPDEKRNRAIKAEKSEQSIDRERSPLHPSHMDDMTLIC